MKQKKQTLLVPSAFTVPTGKAHWEVLLRARAIESQCYVVAAAQAGRHNKKRESYGHSIIIDPWGKVLADAGGASPSLITAEIGEACLSLGSSRVTFFSTQTGPTYILMTTNNKNRPRPGGRDPGQDARAAAPAARPFWEREGRGSWGESPVVLRL